MQDCREIEPGIHQLTIGREPFKGFPPPNAYLVHGSDAAVLIDAGWDDPQDHEARLAYLRDIAAPPLSELIITHRHPDHGGGALHIHAGTGVPMGCHPADREAIERDRFAGKAQVTHELHGGEVRDLGGMTLHVLFAPGHTMGCLAVYVPERGVLFTTDTVMAVSTTVVRPGEGSLTDYAKTLAMFQTLDLKVMYPGHGGPITDPHGRLQSLVAHRKRREEELVEALRKGPQTVTDLRKSIYTGLPESRERLADDQVTTGLHKLMDDGVVTKDDDSTYSLR
ncbi:MAG: MBL fold metallo-hydrolase [Dehalococcoidia bacterium]